VPSWARRIFSGAPSFRKYDKCCDSETIVAVFAQHPKAESAMKELPRQFEDFALEGQPIT
jgi:hypothetical protein